MCVYMWIYVFICNVDTFELENHFVMRKSTVESEVRL